MGKLSALPRGGSGFGAPPGLSASIDVLAIRAAAFAWSTRLKEVFKMRARVLTVLPNPEHRTRLREMQSGALHPFLVVEAAAVTDAVLQLLTAPADLVLIDTSVAEQELKALLQHVRRSAPDAEVLAYCRSVEDVAPSVVEALSLSRGHCLSWGDLERSVREALLTRSAAVKRRSVE